MSILVERDEIDNSLTYFRTSLNQLQKKEDEGGDDAKVKQQINRQASSLVDSTTRLLRNHDSSTAIVLKPYRNKYIGSFRLGLLLSCATLGLSLYFLVHQSQSLTQLWIHINNLKNNTTNIVPLKESPPTNTFLLSLVISLPTISSIAFFWSSYSNACKLQKLHEEFQQSKNNALLLNRIAQVFMVSPKVGKEIFFQDFQNLPNFGKLNYPL